MCLNEPSCNSQKEGHREELFFMAFFCRLSLPLTQGLLQEADI